MAAFTDRMTLRELLSLGDESLDGPLDFDAELGFEVFVPDDAPGQGPMGVLVYISPKAGAKMPPAWAPVLSARNLLWVGANESGNEVDVGWRVQLALFAPAVAARHVEIDPRRVWLSGFSGGGRVASMMMPYYPETFAGAIYICGANPIARPSDEQRAKLERCRYVYLTGTGDFNLLDTEMTYRLFEELGLPGARLMVVDGLGHELPGADEMAEALDWVLDAADR